MEQFRKLSVGAVAGEIHALSKVQLEPVGPFSAVTSMPRF
jgi:hypothetical protein